MCPERWALALILSLATASTCFARPADYGLLGDPELAACDGRHWRGEREAARGCYQQLLQSTASAAIRAEAAWALGDLKTANLLFRRAVENQPEVVATRVRWGQLFAQTYQYQEALKLFSEADALDTVNPFAAVAAAEVLAQQFEGKAHSTLQPVLDDAAAPFGARFAALLLKARMTLEAEDPAAADELLEDARSLAVREKLPLLPVYALLYSADLLKGQTDSVWLDKALAENPAYGDIYATPAYFYWITRRYREAVALYEKAVAVQPDLWLAHLELGINLLRDNWVGRARKHLEIAYQGDPYNPKTVNTLRLLDSFTDYELLNFPEQPPADGQPDLILRLHREQSGVLAPYVRELADESLKQFAQRYDFQFKQPVIIEIYPHHEDFVVRTTGMPGLGILGATFGYVLAMDSPTAHPEADYHWGTTLWHEIAHVVTLEATRHLVPRWFSEGVSVYEEWRSGPTPGVRVPLPILQAMAEDKFLPLAQLDRGFVRPSFPGQVQVSYMQAGLICLFLAERYGFESIVNLLARFAAGDGTLVAVKTVVGLDGAGFDRGFRDFLAERYGDVGQRLSEWREAQRDGSKSAAAADWPAAIEAIRERIETGGEASPVQLAALWQLDAELAELSESS